MPMLGMGQTREIWMMEEFRKYRTCPELTERPLWQVVKGTEISSTPRHNGSLYIARLAH